MTDLENAVLTGPLTSLRDALAHVDGARFEHIITELPVVLREMRARAPTHVRVDERVRCPECQNYVAQDCGEGCGLLPHRQC